MIGDDDSRWCAECGAQPAQVQLAAQAASECRTQRKGQGLTAHQGLLVGAASYPVHHLRLAHQDLPSRYEVDGIAARVSVPADAGTAVRCSDRATVTVGGCGVNGSSAVRGGEDVRELRPVGLELVVLEAQVPTRRSGAAVGPSS